jgi:hypothetical protein
MVDWWVCTDISASHAIPAPLLLPSRRQCRDRSGGGGADAMAGAVPRCAAHQPHRERRPAGADRRVLRLAAGAHPERRPQPALQRAALQRGVGQRKLLPVRVVLRLLHRHVAPRGRPSARLGPRRRLPRPRHRRRVRVPCLEPPILRAILPGRRHRPPSLLELRWFVVLLLLSLPWYTVRSCLMM